MELNGIGDTSLEVNGSLSPGVKELVCKVLEMFVLDSLKGVGSVNRTVGEWLGYFSNFECWLVLVGVA